MSINLCEIDRLYLVAVEKESDQTVVEVDTDNLEFCADTN